MRQLCITILLLYIGTTKSYIFGNLETSNDDIKVKDEPTRVFLPPKDGDGVKRRNLQNTEDVEDSMNDSHEVVSSESENVSSGEVEINRSPIYRRRYDGTKKDYLNRQIQDVVPSEETSTNEDVRTWKVAWKKRWDDMKLEALLEPNITNADQVNMAAARPWSRRCGDPMQHDVPVGVCTISPQCDPELRIYRGDLFCGRTHFVCCSVDITGQDVNQAFDVSFADSSRFSTSSNEKLRNIRGSKENKRRKKERERKLNYKQKVRSKQQMRKKIKKIMKDIYKHINRAYRNNTDKKRHIANNLKAFIDKMKNKYKKDRDMAKDIYQKDMIFISKNLDDKLSKIKELNYNFLTNDTFKELFAKKSTSLVGARMLLEAYPELAAFPELARVLEVPPSRRSGGQYESKKDQVAPKDYLEYDIEYGTLNY